MHPPCTGPAGTSWAAWIWPGGRTLKKTAGYPQLYSHIGFVHEYRPLSADKLAFVLQRHWATLGLELSADDFTDTEAVAAIHRITSGNFRLVQRPFAQITRAFPAGALPCLRILTTHPAEHAAVAAAKSPCAVIATWWPCGCVPTFGSTSMAETRAPPPQNPRSPRAQHRASCPRPPPSPANRIRA